MRLRSLSRIRLVAVGADGLIESRGDYDEGGARLVAAARHHRDNPAQTIPTDIVQDMHNVVRYRDDTLLLALRYLHPRTGSPDGQRQSPE